MDWVIIVNNTVAITAEIIIVIAINTVEAAVNKANKAAIVRVTYVWETYLIITTKLMLFIIKMIVENIVN